MRSFSNWIKKCVIITIFCTGIFLVISVVLPQARVSLTMTRKEASIDDLSGQGGRNPLLPGEINKHQDVIKGRKTHLTEMCRRNKFSVKGADTRQRVLVHVPSSLAMCFVPKVGGSFWKRVFVALQQNLTSISQPKLTKAQTQKVNVTTLKELKPFDRTYKFLSESTKMVFVRDPYSRLFLTYQDKFFVGDFFGSWGRTIVKAVRAKPSKISSTCGHDVKFGEFIDYVTRLFRSSNEEISSGEEHWMPISTLCRPCHFGYDIIGKKDTFVKDRDYIFETFNITLNAKEILSPIELAKDAMKQSMDMIWDKQLPCLSRTEYKKRFWIYFQNQGYIHQSLEFPVEKVSDNITKVDFLNLALDAYKQISMSPSDRELQKKQAMIKAYSFVSYKALFEVPRTFRLDFELFQYEVEPKELFPYES